MRSSTLITTRDCLLLIMLASGVIALVALALEGAPKLYSQLAKPIVAVAGGPIGELRAKEPVVSEKKLASLINEGEAKDAQALNAAFDRIGFDLGLVAAGDMSVPRIILVTLPENIHEVRTPDERKALFLRALLPIVLDVNDRILEERARLVALRDKVQNGVTLKGDDVLWLLELSKIYDQPDADLDALIQKVDIVPNSLALAQAIEESGWGTSRIAREMNALYGQFGLDAGWNYRSFSDLFGTVEAYARNLNTHRAYREFRNIRSAMRTAEESMDSNKLAGTLHRYSERGQAYVQTIRGIMKDNQLSSYDSAQLDVPQGGYFYIPTRSFIR